MAPYGITLTSIGLCYEVRRLCFGEHLIFCLCDGFYVCDKVTTLLSFKTGFKCISRSSSILYCKNVSIIIII